MRKPKSAKVQATLISPTPEKNERINARNAADSDIWELTEEDFARARPASENSSELVATYRLSRGKLGAGTRPTVMPCHS